MNNRYCFWSVVDGDYAEMMKAVVRSAREVGVFRDFHVWADRAIGGAIVHPAGQFEKDCYLFKLDFLQKQVIKLKYDYFVWLDADTCFVRHPGDVLRVMQGSPIHSSLESDACNPRNVRPDWWNCPLPVYAQLMRARGVKSQPIFNVNAGFWIVHHDIIDTFCTLAYDFWHFAKKNGFIFTEEAPLAYATHMLCGNPYLHTLRASTDLWASDWKGYFANRLPDGQPWWFFDYFTEEKIPANPAVVHAMRSKKALLLGASSQISSS